MTNQSEQQKTIVRGLAAGIEAVSTMALLQGTGQVLSDETTQWAATLLKGERTPRAEIIAAAAKAAQEAIAGDSAPESYTVITAIDAKDGSAGYGVMRSESYERWLSGEIEAEATNAFGLLYGNSELVDTFETWSAAAAHVAECDGVIADVIPCMAY